MNRVIVHQQLKPTLSFSSSSNRIVIHHVEPKLTLTNVTVRHVSEPVLDSLKITVKSKTTKKVKMITTERKITVKQRDNKKNLKAVR